MVEPIKTGLSTAIGHLNACVQYVARRNIGKYTTAPPVDFENAYAAGTAILALRDKKQKKCVSTSILKATDRIHVCVNHATYTSEATLIVVGKGYPFLYECTVGMAIILHRANRGNKHA